MARGLSVDPALFLRLARHARAEGAPTSSPPPPPPPAASYLGGDTVTAGAWIGIYGSSGYLLWNTSGSESSLPSWATVAQTGQSSYDWGSTWVVNAARCEDALPPHNPITGTWYSSTSFTIEIDQSVATQYDLSLYLVSGDNYQSGGQGRACSVTITDLAGNTLDGPRTFSEPDSGAWQRWQITGGVKVIVTNTVSGNNATTQGILFN